MGRTEMLTHDKERMGESALAGQRTFSAVDHVLGKSRSLPRRQRSPSVGSTTSRAHSAEKDRPSSATGELPETDLLFGPVRASRSMELPTTRAPSPPATVDNVLGTSLTGTAGQDSGTAGLPYPSLLPSTPKRVSGRQRSRPTSSELTSHRSTSSFDDWLPLLPNSQTSRAAQPFPGRSAAGGSQTDVWSGPDLLDVYTFLSGMDEKSQDEVLRQFSAQPRASPGSLPLAAKNSNTKKASMNGVGTGDATEEMLELMMVDLNAKAADTTLQPQLSRSGRRRSDPGKPTASRSPDPTISLDARSNASVVEENKRNDSGGNHGADYVLPRCTAISKSATGAKNAQLNAQLNAQRVQLAVFQAQPPAFALPRTHARPMSGPTSMQPMPPPVQCPAAPASAPPRCASNSTSDGEWEVVNVDASSSSCPSASDLEANAAMMEAQQQQQQQQLNGMAREVVYGGNAVGAEGMVFFPVHGVGGQMSYAWPPMRNTPTVYGAMAGLPNGYGPVYPRRPPSYPQVGALFRQASARARAMRAAGATTPLAERVERKTSVSFIEEEKNETFYGNEASVAAQEQQVRQQWLAQQVQQSQSQQQAAQIAWYNRQTYGALDSPSAAGPQRGPTVWELLRRSRSRGGAQSPQKTPPPAGQAGALSTNDATAGGVWNQSAPPQWGYGVAELTAIESCNGVAEEEEAEERPSHGSDSQESDEGRDTVAPESETEESPSSPKGKGEKNYFQRRLAELFTRSGSRTGSK